MKRTAGAAALILWLMLRLFPAVALATNERQVCVDNGTKVDVSGSHATLTVTAPDGYLITGYCVKAGSVNQGLGPEYVTVDPPQAAVTISHSSGKDISHYVLYLEEIPSPPTTTVPPTTEPPTTTTPPVTTLPPVTTMPPTTTPVSPPPTVTVPPSSTPASPSVEITPEPVIIEQPEVLAYTGAQSVVIAGIGFLLSVIGASLLLLRKRVR